MPHHNPFDGADLDIERNTSLYRTNRVLAIDNDVNCVSLTPMHNAWDGGQGWQSWSGAPSRAECVGLRPVPTSLFGESAKESVIELADSITQSANYTTDSPVGM